MSCVIEIDGIRVEADNETAARKEMRKAQRAAQKLRDEQAKKQESAENVAKCRAFGVMARILNGETMPRGWRVLSAGSQGCAVKAECVRYGVQKLTVNDYDRAAGEYRTVSREVYAYAVDGVVENGAGETLVIWLQESVGEDAAPYAIAACDGAVGIVPLPKAVGKELFRDKREE